MNTRHAMAGDESLDCVTGWAACVAWIDAWRRFGDWIVVDRSTHPDICRSLAPDSWQVLWYDSIEAGDVLALLTELRSRKETRRILVVYRTTDSASLDSPEVATLRRICRNCRAALLAVIPDR